MNSQISRHIARRCQLGAVAFAAASLALQGSVQAATATTNLLVSATVVSNCSITVNQAVAFGTYDPLVTNATVPLDTTGSIRHICTAGQSGVITLSQGDHTIAGSNATTPRRAMIRDGSIDVLSYFLHIDSTRLNAWGDVSASGSAVNGTGLTQTTTVYGRVTQGQTVAPGSYSDTVVATITF